MIKRIFINIILVSFLEILVYTISIFLLWKIGLFFHEPVSKNIFWGFSIVYSIYAFTILVLIKNIIEEIYKSQKIILYSFTLIIFSFIIEEFEFIPLRTTLLIIAALIAISTKYIYSNKTHLKSKIFNLKS
jgi:hypothetical protein